MSSRRLRTPRGGPHCKRRSIFSPSAGWRITCGGGRLTDSTLVAAMRAAEAVEAAEVAEARVAIEEGAAAQKKRKDTRILTLTAHVIRAMQVAAPLCVRRAVITMALTLE